MVACYYASQEHISLKISKGIKCTLNFVHKIIYINHLTNDSFRIFMICFNKFTALIYIRCFDSHLLQLWYGWCLATAGVCT